MFAILQLVFVSVGASRPPRKTDGSLSSSSLPCPVIDRLPVMLLITEPHFNKLFLLLEQLSKLQLTIPSMVCRVQFAILPCYCKPTFIRGYFISRFFCDKLAHGK
jgi:hypothetical protein